MFWCALEAHLQLREAALVRRLYRPSLQVLALRRDPEHNPISPPIRDEFGGGTWRDRVNCRHGAVPNEPVVQLPAN